MEEWKQDRLIDILDTLIDYRGKTPNKVEHGIPLITAKIVKNGRIETPTEFLPAEEYEDWMVRGFPQVGDVVLTTEAPLGEVAQIKDNKIALAQRIVCLRGKEDVLDNTYLKYFLMSNIGQYRLKARETGTTVTGIKQSELKEILIDYPNYEYQKKIAFILSSLDDKISLNRRINDNLEQQAQALFKSWFVDFEPFKDGKFVESEMGMIPDGWNVTLFSNIVKVSGGGTPRTNIDKYWNGDIPFFTPKDASPLYYTYTTEKHLTPSGIDNCNSRLYPSNTIIVTARGTVGKVRLLAVPMAMNQSCYALLPCSGISVFYAFLLMKSLVDIMKKKSNGAVFDAITTKDFAEKIILPRDGVLNDFSKVISPLLEKIRELGRESHGLALLRDALLPRLMSGELKINDLNC